MVLWLYKIEWWVDESRWWIFLYGRHILFSFVYKFLVFLNPKIHKNFHCFGFDLLELIIWFSLPLISKGYHLHGFIILEVFIFVFILVFFVLVFFILRGLPLFGQRRFRSASTKDLSFENYVWSGMKECADVCALSNKVKPS